MRGSKRSLVIAALALGACGTPNHNPEHPANARDTNLALVSDDGFALTPASYRAESGGAPIALTTPDGNALRLASVESRSVVEGPLAFTELHLSFDNPEDRTIEGRFRIALPPRASVSRFAMKIDGRWQEGEMVEKHRAKRIYEDFLHRKVDPALLEQGEGNSFSARVFPIAGRARKELILSYSQEITKDDDVLVPLRGLPELEKVELSVASQKGDPNAQNISQAAYTPTHDFVVGPKLSAVRALRSGNLAVARVAPMASAAADPLGDTLVLIDTSASRALELDAQLALASKIAARIGDGQLVVAAFDQTIAEIHRGPGSAFGQSQLERLRARRALGASDLGSALRWAGATAARHGLTRLVLLSDGVVTAGVEDKALNDTVVALKKAGVARFDAVVYGGIRDEDALRTLVTAGLARDGVVLDGREPDDALRRLALATRSGVAIDVSGARWWWPRKLDGVQPGDEVLIYAELPSSSELSISIDGKPRADLAFERVPRPLLERSWARAKINSLLEVEQREGSSETLRKRVTELSLQHRVVSPYTSLLVLETQADYDRYNLARESLADILTVSGGELEVLQRDAPAAPPKRDARFAVRPAPTAPPPSAPAPSAPWGRDDSLGTDPLSARGNMWGDEIGEAFGASGLGLSGIGEGGSGRGEGIGLGDVGTIGHGAGQAAPPPAAVPPGEQGFGAGQGRLGQSHRARPPQIRMGATSVSGRLPPEVIQRIVRQNMGRFRAHYQQLLLRDPNAAGRVSVRFIIQRDGSVGNVAVSGDFSDQRFMNAVAQSFYALTFPEVEGGVVTVSYPLMFRPDGSDEPVPSQAPASTWQGVAADGRAVPDETATPIDVAPSAPGQPHHARPYRGMLATVMQAISEGRANDALADAQSWQAEEPGSVLAIVALGEALEASDKPSWAARAYGSIIDMYPSRADLRRYAGERLDRIAHAAARGLASDSYARAKAQRPDHPTSHRLYGYALLKQGAYEAAFDAVAEGLPHCTGRFAAVQPILHSDLGIIAAAWNKHDPGARERIASRLKDHHATMAKQPSLRFVLSWETDTNDVDLHIYDTDGNHAYYQEPRLKSGGQLFGDVTSGYGPELFEIGGGARSSGYFLQAHYYSRGPMGFGMGKVQIIDHDGDGTLKIDERPFVVMVDRAFVDLGTVGNWLPPKG